jgi:hypothetical protein
MTSGLCNNEMLNLSAPDIKLEIEIKAGLAGSGSPYPSIVGLIDIFLLALFRTEVDNFVPILKCNGEARIHVHSAYRIFHHPVRGFGRGGSFAPGLDESGKKTPKQINNQEKRSQLN